MTGYLVTEGVTSLTICVRHLAEADRLSSGHRARLWVDHSWIWQ